MASFSSALQVLRCMVPLSDCRKRFYSLYLVKVSCLTGGQYNRVHAAFPLLLSDYGIKPIKRFMLKVKDEIRVEVALNLVNFGF